MKIAMQLCTGENTSNTNYYHLSKFLHFCSVDAFLVLKILKQSLKKKKIARDFKSLVCSVVKSPLMGTPSKLSNYKEINLLSSELLNKTFHSALQTLDSASSDLTIITSLSLSSSTCLDILPISLSSRRSPAFFASSSLARLVASTCWSIVSFSCFSKSWLACCR